MKFILSAAIIASVQGVQLTQKHPSDAWFSPDFVLNNGNRPI